MQQLVVCDLTSSYFAAKVGRHPASVEQKYTGGQNNATEVGKIDGDIFVSVKRGRQDVNHASNVVIFSNYTRLSRRFRPPRFRLIYQSRLVSRSAVHSPNYVYMHVRSISIGLRAESRAQSGGGLCTLFKKNENKKEE